MTPRRYKLVRDYETERQDKLDEIVRRSGEKLRAEIDHIFADVLKRKAKGTGA